MKLPCAFSIRQAKMSPDLSPLVFIATICSIAAARTGAAYVDWTALFDKTAPKKIVVSNVR